MIDTNKMYRVYVGQPFKTANEIDETRDRIRAMVTFSRRVLRVHQAGMPGAKFCAELNAPVYLCYGKKVIEKYQRFDDGTWEN